MLLNFSDRTGTGVFSMVWPLPRVSVLKVVAPEEFSHFELCAQLYENTTCTDKYIGSNLLGLVCKAHLKYLNMELPIIYRRRDRQLFSVTIQIRDLLNMKKRQNLKHNDLTKETLLNCSQTFYERALPIELAST